MTKTLSDMFIDFIAEQVDDNIMKLVYENEIKKYKLILVTHLCSKNLDELKKLKKKISVLSYDLYSMTETKYSLVKKIYNSIIVKIKLSEVMYIVNLDLWEIVGLDEKKLK